MGLVVNTNMPALNSSNVLNKNGKKVQKSMQKLASGFKINSAADDASGLAISEKMRNQITALDTVVDDCEDGANLLQTAEGNISEIQEMINRMVELAGKSANGVLDDDDRSALQDEMFQLSAEVDRISTTANFNGTKLLSGDGEKRTWNYVRTKVLENIYVEIDESEKMAGKSDVDTVREIVKAVENLNPNPIKPNIGKVLAREEIHTKYYNDQLKEYESSELSVEPDEKCPDLPSLNAYYKKTDNPASVVISDSPPPGFSSPDWVEVGINYDYDYPIEKTLLDKREPIDTVELKIGESSTKPDQMRFKRPDLHSNKIFNTRTITGTTTVSSSSSGAAGGFGSAGNIGGGSYTINVYSNDYIKNPVSTYKNAIAFDIRTQDKASVVFEKARAISDSISKERGAIGALQNRIEYTVNSTVTASENTTAAMSRIKDTDMAREMSEYTSKNVINQAAQAMLAQANSHPQEILSLIQQ